MMMQFILSSLEDTKSLATTLHQCLVLPSVLALQGDLGAGKTSFTQLLAEAYGLPGPYPSPTFTLLNEYKSNALTFIHADFYRLDHEEDAAGLGIQDYFTQPKTVTVVEWADRFLTLFPVETLWLRFELTDAKRVVTLDTADQAFRLRLQQRILG